MDEEVAGTGRNVKRRVERNEEILNWRKLKVSRAHRAAFFALRNGCGPHITVQQEHLHTALAVCCVASSHKHAAWSVHAQSSTCTVHLGAQNCYLSSSRPRLTADHHLLPRDAWAEEKPHVQGKEADLKLTRSKVHAWGLTAVKPIQAEQFVIEYTGELIRLSVNTMRERLDSDSDYRFRVDDQWVVDATTKVSVRTWLSVLLLFSPRYAFTVGFQSRG